MLILLGFALGLLKETCVVCYYKAVQKNKVYRGTGLTFVIDVLDFAVIAKLVLDRELWMIAGYIMGKTLATFIVLKFYKGRAK